MEQKEKLDTTNDELLKLSGAFLEIQVMGGVKISGLDRMRVTLKILSTQSDLFPLRYNLDLYNTDQCEKLIRRMGEYFQRELAEVRALVMALIQSLEEYRAEKLKASEPATKKKKEMTPEEEKTAIAYLKQKDLLKKLGSDIGKSGVVGEETNRLLMYIVFTSRKLKNPLHIITLGHSGAGKTHLQEKVGELFPEEDRIEITSLTKNSLYYFGETELNEKLILIEDLDGASEEAMYAIRELQSKRRLTKTLAVKDSRGKIRTQSITVEGRVTIAGTTTRDSIYEDNSNRSILIHVDTSQEQDERIMQYQQQRSGGQINLKAEQQLKQALQNLQRVLLPARIKNPYAPYLKIPKAVKTPRRTLAIYLGFIECITFLHQYQRPLKADSTGDKFLETTVDDIRWANRLLQEVLLRKSDDLSAAARNTLEQIKAFLAGRKEQTFYSRDIRLALRINVNTLKRHLRELEKSDYIKVNQGSRYLGYEYRVLSQQEYEELRSHIYQELEGLTAGLMKVR